MATSSTGISSLGVGSGLDASSIISKLMQIEQQPLTKLQTTAQTLQSKLSAVGQLKSLVSTFKDAVAPLVKPSSYDQFSASSSDSAVLVSANSDATPGSYSVNVSSVAAGQTLVSPQGQFSLSTDTVGTGTLTLRLGTWSDDLSTFTPKSGSSNVNVTIDGSHNTLEGVRDQINAANAGVTASIVTDTSGSRLSIRSNATGAENGFRLTVADADGTDNNATGLSRLAYDPAGSNAQMTRAQAAVDTKATINGINVSSATQKIEGAIEGVTFTANKVTTSAATVTVSANTGAVATMVNQFVSAYNSLTKALASSTSYNDSTKAAGIFQGDSTVVTLQNQLRSMLGQGNSASSMFNTLSSLGVQLQKDGTLKVDSTTLNNALANNLSDVTKALVGTTANGVTTPGLMKRFADWSDGLLAFNGTLTGRTESLQRQIDSNKDDQTAVQARLSAVQQRLVAQYSALDATMSKANSLSSYVSQQLTALANMNSNDN